MSARFAGVVVGVALLITACGDDTEATTPAAELPDGIDRVIALEVVDGELVGGSRQVDVDAGDRVQVAVTGNTDDLVHVHGYDLYVEPIEGEGELEFDALIPGTFEIELENSGRLLVRMTVS